MKLSLLCSLLALTFITKAAIITTGGSGNWSSTVPNAPWPSGTIPASTDDIVIGAGFTLTVDGNRTANSLIVGNGSTITVNTGVILTITTSLSFPNLANTNTTGTIAGAGTINTSTLTIAGSVVPTTSQTVNVTSTINALTVSGTATLTSQRVAAGNITNNPTFQLQSGTVTINGTLSCVTTANAASTTLVTLATGAQTGTLILGNATPITTSGNAGVSTFTFTGTSATVNYSGAAQTVFNVNYTNLILSGSGTKTLQTSTTTIGGSLTLSGTASATTVVALAITSNLNIGDGTLFTVAGFNITVSGTTTIGGGTSGQLILSVAAGTKTFNAITIGASGTWNNSSGVAVSISGNVSVGSGATFTQGTGLVTFTGATSNTVTSVNTTLAFGGGITVNKGTSQANVIDIQATITLLVGNLTLTNGTFKLSSNSSITPFNSDPGFGATAQLWCNGGTMLGDTRVTFSGAIQVSAGTLNIGTSSDDYLFPNGGSITISGGALNVAGALSDDAGGPGGGMTFNMSGGTCTLNTVGSTLDYPLFIDSGSQFTMTGGTLVIQNPGNVPGFPNAGYFNHATSTFTGGTLQIGNSFTSTSSIIGIDANSSVFNLSINSSNAIAQVQTQALTVSNNVTISSGTLVANGYDISVGGNWTNNGTFTPGTTTVTLSGAAQTISGSSPNFYNLLLGGTNTKTFSATTTISSNLSISTGVVVNLSTITTHTTRTLTLNGTNQTATGSWGGTTSGAMNINTTFFATATGKLNVSNVIYFSRQTGNWNANATWSTVTYGGAAATAFPVAGDDVNIGGGSFTITVNVNSACGSLSYQSNALSSPVVSISTGITLNVSGAITIPRAGVLNVNTLAVGAGILNTGSVVFTNSGSLILVMHQITISTGTVTVSGDVTADAGSTGSPAITFTGAGTLNLAGAFLNSSNGTLTTATGSTVNYNGATQTVGDFTYYNLTLSGSGTKDLSIQNTVTTINNNFVLSGTVTAAPVSNLTIGGGATFGTGTTFTTGTLTHSVAGNWTNNGATINTTGSTINFNGAAQAIGGTSSTTFNNLSLSNTNTKTFSVATTIGSNLSIAIGVVANLSTITTHTARTLTLSGINQTATGTWGGTTSGATNINTTFFATATGLLNVTNVIYFSRQTGNWDTPATWSTVTYAGAAATAFPVAGDDVNIGGGNFTVTVNVNSACGTLSFRSGTANSPFVSISTGITLAVSGAITIPRTSTGNVNTLAVGAGTLTAGSLAFTNTNSNAVRHLLTISTGTVTINGDVTTTAVNVTSPTITFTGAGILQLGGAFFNSTNGTLNRGTGTVTYIGTVAQTIGDFTYYNLTFNNTSATIPQLKLANNITNGSFTIVTNNLTMTSGVVNLNGASLDLGSGAIASLSRTASTATNWVYGGTFTRYWQAATAITSTSGNFYGLFPMGSSSASSYRPVEINSTVSPTGSGTYSVTHSSSTGVTDLSPTYNDAGTSIVRVNNSQFVGAIFGVTGGTYTINVTMTGITNTGSTSDLRLAIYTGGTTASAVGTYSAATGTVANPTAIRTGLSVTDLSNDFRISTSNSAATPLPVKLLSFSAIESNGTVLLRWSTATEIDNDFFTIQRAATGEDFVDILKVKGKGTSLVQNNYEAIDTSPISGRSYYRLIQTDFDGHSTSAEVVEVEVTEVLASIYPNPVDQHELLNIEINGLLASSPSMIRVLDIRGAIINQLFLNADANGTLKTVLTTASLSPGIYILSVQGVYYRFVVK